MLSFDISDRQVHIVKGDNAGGKIKIEKSLTVEVPEEMIMSGEVINLSGLASGVYIAHIQTESGIIDLKFVKQR